MSTTREEFLIKLVIILAFIGSFFGFRYVYQNTSYTTELCSVHVASKRHVAAYTSHHTIYHSNGKGGGWTSHSTQYHPERFVVCVEQGSFSESKDSKSVYDQVEEGQYVQMAVTFRLWKNKKDGISDFELVEQIKP